MAKHQLVWRVRLGDIEKNVQMGQLDVIAATAGAAAKKAEDAIGPMNDGVGYVYNIQAMLVELLSRSVI